MKNKELFYSISILLLFFSYSYAIDYNDGSHHIINGTSEMIQVDWETPEIQTSVEIQDDASVSWIIGYEDSIIDINGGTTGSVDAFDRCQLNISGGHFFQLFNHDNSFLTITNGQLDTLYQALGYCTVDISGGVLTEGAFIQFYSTGVISGGQLGNLTVADYSQMTIKGGIFGEIYSGSYRRAIDYETGEYTIHSASITFEGADFAINGNPVNYGDSARNYLTPINNWMSSGTLTGTLASGESIHSTIYIIEDSDIVFVPEPATLSLLVLGAMLAGRKRRT